MATLLLLAFFFFSVNVNAQKRQVVSLNNNWVTAVNDSNQHAYNGFENTAYKTNNWKAVNVPHTWDTYEGYRRMKHGNRHGYAWYKKTFLVKPSANKQRYFIQFEGIGSYATIYLNGKEVGVHAGGRTTFTIDITNTMVFNKNNELAVKVGHPAFIKDLPWVCGGCSDEVGFSEGSQPMGIFRPVSLVVTDEIRVEPFGIHIWNDTTVTEKAATLFLETTVKNYSASTNKIVVKNLLLDTLGKVISSVENANDLLPQQTINIQQQFSNIRNVALWSLENPYLYIVKTQVLQNGKVVDEITTPYGIRWISWPLGKTDGQKQFLLNGKPVFINGTAEYEHALGNSGAFTNEEIKARVSQLKAAGYNAFRDAHQPHNLQYQTYWDKDGLLWWPQFAAHIFYNTPEFKNNFKKLLKDWVIERRNNPSNILWGLENESVLPEDFAKECSDIIRSLDPTASTQRKITTCNGGKGTDWDVPQNWTGTYGGNPATYGDDLMRQVLVGEYGAWRSLDLHDAANKNTLSEEYMTSLMETKVRLADSVKDKVAGHFHWLLYSHENPGRAQSGEGYRELDRIGPVNYKGLFTLWGEPTDVFYMFRSNFVDKVKAPMVYIASHTWPDRWIKPGLKDSIIIYSNCDEVELFNDVNGASLGKQKRGGVGTHFTFNKVNIQYNVLYAVGYVNGKAVVHDLVVLNHLPKAKNLYKKTTREVVKPAPGLNYVCRVNCGGDEYKDALGNVWQADHYKNSNTSFGSSSWANEYDGVNKYFASQRSNLAAIKNTNEWALFRDYRYGRDKLKYEFPLPDGDYIVELFFSEAWYGVSDMNSKEWRLFDVAINDKTVIKDLDIWNAAGYNAALKKSVTVHVTGGKLVISFPTIKASQAVISAIAIASKNKGIKAAQNSIGLIKDLSANTGFKVKSWLNTGSQQFTDKAYTVSNLPAELYGADWLQMPQFIQTKVATSFVVNDKADVYVGVSSSLKPAWLKDFKETKTYLQNDGNDFTKYILYKKSFDKNEKVVLENAGSDSTNYFVAAVQLTSIDPAYDLKQTTSYRADKATLNLGVKIDSINGKSAVRFVKADNAKMVFGFSVGVANTYSIRFRYSNETEKIIKVLMQIKAADGTVMKSEMLTFNPYIKGKWGIVNTGTNGNINAGNYTIELTGKDAEGLGLSSLEIQ